MTELSNVWETGWKIEGRTEETAPGREPAQRTASRNRPEDRGEFLPEERRVDGPKPCPFSPGPKTLPEERRADRERSVRPRDN